MAPVTRHCVETRAIKPAFGVTDKQETLLFV